jgi:hypothetical protein
VLKNRALWGWVKTHYFLSLAGRIYHRTISVKKIEGKGNISFSVMRVSLYKEDRLFKKALGLPAVDRAVFF